MDPWSYWLCIVLLVLFSGLLSGSETALASCNQFKFRVRASDNDRIAKAVCYILDRYDKLSISIVIENDIVNTVISTLAASLFLEYYLTSNETLANIVSTLVVTIILYVVADTVPKILARNSSSGFISLTSLLLISLYYILWPINISFYYLTLAVKRIFKVKDNVTMTEEDFSNFIENSEETGELEEDESNILQNALDFVDTSIKDIYTPLKKIYAIDIKDLNNEQLNKILINSNYSRIPVYYGNKQNIVGILNVKKYFNSYMDNPKNDFRNTLSKPYFVTPNVKLDDIFDSFKESHNHIALIKVKDQILGMITMEDVLEELVGEIAESAAKQEETK